MASFLDLPSELRNRVYELCLLHQEPINPLIGNNSRWELTPGLLRANKTVHREASSLLYGQNCFDLSWATHEGVALFLGSIGCKNADYIKHICTEFPNFRDLEPGNVTFEEDSSGIFASILSSCANLRTLKMSLDSTNGIMLKLDELDYPKVAIEALTLVNSRLRAISSLQDIVVEVYENRTSEHLKKAMEDHGWTVSEIEYVEDWGFDRSYGDDDYGYTDDYDIDNDSDFWRRAGD